MGAHNTKVCAIARIVSLVMNSHFILGGGGGGGRGRGTEVGGEFSLPTDSWAIFHATDKRIFLYS